LLLECCAHHLTSEALLLDLERLHARSLALVARRSGEANDGEISEWLAARVREAASQLIEEERYEERLGFPPQRDADPRSELLVNALGIEPALTRGVSVSFHRLSREDRRAFWRTVISGEPISGGAAVNDQTRDEVLSVLRRVIRSLSLSGARARGEESTQPETNGQENE